MVYNINQVSLRQSITPERMQGRMNATMRFIVWGTMPVGATIGGVIATAVGVTQALWVGSILGLHGVPAGAPGAGAAAARVPVSAARSEAVATQLVAEAAMSGLEPMGISMPRSVDGLRRVAQCRSAAMPEPSEVSARAPATARTAVAE